MGAPKGSLPPPSSRSAGELRWIEYSSENYPNGFRDVNPVEYERDHGIFMAGYLARPATKQKQKFSAATRMLITDKALDFGYMVDKVSDTSIVIRSKVTGKAIWSAQFSPFSGYLTRAEGMGKVYVVKHLTGAPTARQVRDEFISTEFS